ncbi:hypothetical protein ACFV5N_15665 [Streptomyces sp. NPDC059853]|uniref:hypothetical protein n=1 Tax=Streptomyces sp. NPDC059853 TaxID=3346973 RepID=UPI0036614C7D
MTDAKQAGGSRGTGVPAVLEDSNITSEPKGGKLKPLEDSNITSEPTRLEDSNITSEPIK